MNLINKISDYSIKAYNNILNLVPFKCDADYLILLKQVDLSCYSKEELHQYEQLVNSLIFDCKESKDLIQVDDSNFDKWAKENPNCVGLDLWERIAKQICIDYKITLNVSRIDTTCPLPNLNITLKDLTCNVGLEISRNIICPEVLTVISVNKYLCKTDFKITRTIDECTIDYKLLTEKYPFLNLTKKEYFRLVEDKFSYKMVDCIYENNLKLQINNNKIYLDTNYNLYDIDSIDLEKILITKNKGAKLLIQLIEDFQITNKQRILNGAVYI